MTSAKDSNTFYDNLSIYWPFWVCLHTNIDLHEALTSLTSSILQKQNLKKIKKTFF